MNDMIPKQDIKQLVDLMRSNHEDDSFSGNAYSDGYCRACQFFAAEFDKLLEKY